MSTTWRSSLRLLQQIRWQANDAATGSLRSSRSLTISPKLRQSLPPLATRMLEDGLPDISGGLSSEKHQGVLLRRYMAMCKSPEERHETAVSLNFLLNAYRLSSSACEQCLYPKQRCMCALIRKTRPQHRLWLFQHVGEYGRSNNTGSLLCLMAGAKRTIRGLQHEQNKMMDHVSERLRSTVILFPTDDSITVDQYTDARKAAMGSNAEKEPLTLILLDGTSRQAKNLDRFMPTVIPRIRIREARVKSWLDPIRRQTEEHRVCTAQAAAMILKELGDTSSSNIIEEAVRNVVRLANMRRYPSRDLGMQSEPAPTFCM